MRRTYLFFPFGYKNEIHRQLASRCLHRMERSEKGRFRTFLIHCTAADHDFAEAWLINNLCFRWRRRPFARVELFHVVHEIKPNRFWRPGIKSSEDTRLSLGLDPFRAIEAGVFQELDHIIRALGITAVLGRDRDLRDPTLEPFYSFIVLLSDLR